MASRRHRIVELGLSLAAIALALWGTESDSPFDLFRGAALLGFWLLAAVTTGRFLARDDDALRSFLYTYLYILLSLLAAGALHAIDSFSLTLLNAVCFVTVSVLRREAAPELTPESHWPRSDALTTTLLVLLGGIALLGTAWAFLAPIAQTDDLTYHLVFPVEWAQSRTLSNRLVAFGNHSPAYHPKNTELIFTWLFLPVRSFAHIALAQTAFVLATVAAIVDILKRCRVANGTAWIVGMLYWCSPVVIHQLGGGYVDLAFACFFVMAVRALLILRERPTLAGWIDLSVIVGLLLGTKSFGILIAALILSPLAVCLLWPRRKRLAPPRWLPLLGCPALLIAAGGWWQLRNLLETGNPLFPVQVELFGRRLFEGAYARTALGAADPASLIDLLPLPLWLLFGIGAIWTAARLSLRIATLAILLPAALALVYWTLMPTGYSRFVLAITPLSAMVLALPLESSGWGARLTRLALLLAVLFSLARGSILLLPSQMGLSLSPFVGIAFAASLLGLIWIALAIWWRRRLFAFGALLPACAILWLGMQTADPRAGHLTDEVQQRWRPYLQLRRDAGALRTAISGTNAALYAFGPGYTNPVRYINVNAGGDALFHDHFKRYRGLGSADRSDPSGVAYYRRDKSYRAWAQNLANFDTELLIVTRMPWWALKRGYERDALGFPIERQWAERHPERFEPVLVAEGIRAYRLRN